MNDVTKDLLEALREERHLRLIGQLPNCGNIHWESLRDMRRDAYARTDAAIASAEAALAAPQPDADGWIPWAGGECPVRPDDDVDIRLRDECSLISWPAGRLRWTVSGSASDIIAYRVVKP